MRATLLSLAACAPVTPSPPLSQRPAGREAQAGPRPHVEAGDHTLVAVGFPAFTDDGRVLIFHDDGQEQGSIQYIVVRDREDRELAREVAYNPLGDVADDPPSAMTNHAEMVNGEWERTRLTAMSPLAVANIDRGHFERRAVGAGHTVETLAGALIIDGHHRTFPATWNAPDHDMFNGTDIHCHAEPVLETAHVGDALLVLSFSYRVNEPCGTPPPQEHVIAL